MKRCGTCKQTLSVSEFHFQNRATGERSTVCKPCMAAYRRAYDATESGRRKNRDRMLRHNYGITLVQYEALFTAQAGLCAICAEPEKARGWKQDTKLLAVDHDHETGCIRGLLCQRCNIGIGHLPTAERLAAALAYLDAVSVRM